MARMKWVRSTTDFSQTSECGRFILRTVCLNPFRSGYWGLTDKQTGREYPCRTEASAKTAARNLRNQTAQPKETP